MNSSSMRSPMQSTVRRASACDKASKSNIGARYNLGSAETVGGIEIAFHITLDRLLQRGEAAVVAGAAQPIDFALREVLITVADLLGHVDIADIRLQSECGMGRQHQIPEAARLTGADVEDA